MGSSGYHHGNLRRALLDAALHAITEHGATAWSLRELARRANVSHAAPAHHFGDKTGVLTAVAAEGYAMFADTLERQSHDFRQVGVAYVRFALENPAHFTVMFRPDLYRVDDPAVVAGRDRARAVLSEGARTLTPEAASGESDRAVALMAWSCAHGFAHLWLSGAFPESIGNDPEQAAHAVFGAMFGAVGLGG
ncbi:TetR/AcrR family transcriptional regulator [Saccharomonospora xinjiangensis]|uniref:TetR/AcrR family transcriptional regulator n=1 Tax=Saccharomonospora xinjiangensis TaxID=75294 RepID=UPI00106F13E6|nr:TetR-like C-terminal domain-containing protein [Saccharomonospora xinjiangensis]